MPEPLMLTPASTVSSPLTYETAREDLGPTSSGGRDEEVDETIDISTRIRDTLPVRIPPLTEKQLAQALSIVPPDGPQFRCWFCREVGHTMYTCPFLTVAQQRYCAYQGFLFSESKASAEGASAGTRRAGPGSSRADRAKTPRGEDQRQPRSLRWGDTKHPRILRRNSSDQVGREVSRPVLALPTAEPEMPAPSVESTALREEEDSESSVDIPLAPRESEKE